MDVAEAVEKRMSVRAFRPDAVPAETVRAILQTAHRAPSGGNLQPWRVYALTGAPLADLKTAAMAKMAQGGEAPEYHVYPPNLWDPFRTRRYECGEDLYASIGIPREDKPARLMQMAKNAALFGAPVGLFFTLDRKVGPPQWADVGHVHANGDALGAGARPRHLRPGVLGPPAADGGRGPRSARARDAVFRHGLGSSR